MSPPTFGALADPFKLLRRAARLAAPPRRPRGGAPRLEVLRAGRDPARAPLLLLHGAGAGAWMWAEHAMPALAAAGRRAVAPSFRGHGASAGDLSRASLDDYLEDAARVARSLPRAPVVVAHSLGALVAQRLLGRVPLAGLVLAAPVPPEGMAGEGLRLAVLDASARAEGMARAYGGVAGAATHSLARALYGAEPDAAALALLDRMGPESPRALAEAHLPAPVASAALLRVPALVVAAGEDRLVSRDAARRTALYHGARFALAEGAGHALMLEREARPLLAPLLAWLDDRRL